MVTKKLKKKVSFAYIHKLTAAVSLLALVVIIAAGIMGEARTITIAYRACAAIIIIGIISRIVLKILCTNEEMNSGKA